MRATMPKAPMLIKADKHLACLVLFLLIVFPFLFIGGPTPYSTALFSACWNVGHFIFFAGLAILLIKYSSYFQKHTFLLVSMFILMLGGGIEIIQAHIGRDGNGLDVLRDLAGAWVACIWFGRQYRLTHYAKWFSWVFFVPDIVHISSAASAQFYAANQFPVLSDFESSIEMRRYKGQVNRVSDVYSHGQYALQIHLNSDAYSGVTLNEFYQSWQGYTQLEFDIFNPEPKALFVTIRVSDVEHYTGSNDYNDRFNQRLHLLQGWNHFKIPVKSIELAPKNRKMDLTHIESIVIFAMSLQHPQDIYLDHLRLTK